MIIRAVPIWLDLLCIGFGAFQGALFAIFYKRFDLVGVISVAVIAGLGGGILRDLLLSAGRPAGMQDKYILTAVGGAVAALIIGRWYRKSSGVIVLLDSIAMSLFAIAGTYKALIYDTTDLVAVILGIITAVGGGVLRDIVCRVTPQIFTGGPLYATATAIGSTIFVFLERSDLPFNIAVALSVLSIVVIHMTSVRFRIHLKPAISGIDGADDFEEPNQGR
ncbi:MAG: trimeric intracellular cation channel family protein [Actinomycetales bacterium]